MFKLGKVKKAAEDHLNQYKSKNPASYAAAQQAIGGVLILDGFVGIEAPFGENKRPGIFGSLIGVALGVAFLFVPTIFNKFSGVNEMTAQTQATIVSVRRQSSSDGGDSCSATARYTVEGKEYTQNSAFGSGSLCSLYPDSTATISYNPNKPGSWGYDIKSLGTIMKIFQGVGAITIILSGFTFLIRLLSIYFGWKLLKSGRALAKTLPPGTNLDTMIAEIKQNFTGQLFNFGGNMQSVPQQNQGAAAVGGQAPVQTPAPVTTQPTQTNIPPPPQPVNTPETPPNPPDNH